MPGLEEKLSKMQKALEFDSFTKISLNQFLQSAGETGVLVLFFKHTVPVVNRVFSCLNMGTLTLGGLGWIKQKHLQDKISRALEEHCLKAPCHSSSYIYSPC